MVALKAGLRVVIDDKRLTEEIQRSADMELR